MKRIIVLIGYLVIILAIVFLYLDHQAGKAISQETGVKNFVIEKGDGLKNIAENLEKDGLIQDKTSFIFYTILRNLRKNFLPGEYELQKNISVKKILNILTTPVPLERKITLIEGWNNEEIASYLEKNRIIEKNDFLNSVDDLNLYQEKYQFLQNEKIKTLEGFIFPDTYQVKTETTAEEIILKTLNNFNRKLDQKLKDEIDARGLNLYDVLIMASIVEKEVANQKDREIVAGIFWKRLNNYMGLQADSTINYITGKSESRASAEDLKVDSLYNTYKYRGLPPGPICNPGLEAIEATIFYQETPYWYFLTNDQGIAIFSQTFEEHKANKAKYLSFDHDLEKSFEIAMMPDDPYYNEEWYLKKIGAETAWGISTGIKNEIVIALLDSGVDIDHPDLKDNIWINKKEIPGDKKDNDGNGYVDDINGWDFVNNIADPNPKFYPSYSVVGMNHGTVVAGLMAAKGNNKIGITGLSWNVKIMPVRVLNNNGDGSLEDVIKGIDYAIKNKADVINLSFVGPNSSDLLFETIKRAWDNNIFIVAAAGNNSTNNGRNLDEDPLYPVCLDSEYKENIILGVTSVDNNDKKTSFANYGKSCIDIAAPGSKVYSTLFYSPSYYSFRDYYGGYWSGTSLAAPLVSASAALIKSLNPLISNREIRNIILATVDPVADVNINLPWFDKTGVGRINIAKAVSLAFDKLVTVSKYLYLVVSPGKNFEPMVRVMTSSGLEYSEFYAYDKNFRGGVSLATGDVNGDGIYEIITGAGKGGGPHVRIFNDLGGLKNQFFAYDDQLRIGINVASGDLNGDGRDEIVVASQTESLPIRVFDFNGKKISEFYAYDKNFRGGVSLATGDVNGDGIYEIITGAGKGGGPHVRIFNIQGVVLDQFFAYNKNFRGGINVASGDLNRDGLDEIVVSIASGASPYVRIFNSSLYLLAQFLAYDSDHLNGVLLSVGDLDGDLEEDIITAPYQGGGPQLRFFDKLGKLKNQFFAYEEYYNTGLNMATIKKFE